MAEQMLVTTALKELKLLDARITKKIDEARFVTSLCNTSNMVDEKTSRDDFTKEVRSNLQSIRDLIKRRDLIKSKISESNAVTWVSVGGESMTVASAIDKKHSIAYYQLLLDQMQDDLTRAEARKDAENIKVEKRVDNIINVVYGGDKDSNDALIAVRNYRDANEWEVYDPVDIQGSIKDISDYVIEFITNVDSVLQISNCTTYIEF